VDSAAGRHELTVTSRDYLPQKVMAFIEAGKITPLEVWLFA
jgi:hypothetical protein